MCWCFIHYWLQKYLKILTTDLKLESRPKTMKLLVYISENKKQGGSSSSRSSSSAEHSIEFLSLRHKQGTVSYSKPASNFCSSGPRSCYLLENPGFRSWPGTMLNGMESSGLPQFLQNNARITHHHHSCTL